MKECPKCKHDAICVLNVSFAVDFDGTQISLKVSGYCNTRDCDQRFWYYPRTGKITQRNSGAVSPYYHSIAQGNQRR